MDTADVDLFVRQFALSDQNQGNIYLMKYFRLD